MTESQLKRPLFAEAFPLAESRLMPATPKALVIEDENSLNAKAKSAARLRQEKFSQWVVKTSAQNRGEWVNLPLFSRCRPVLATVLMAEEKTFRFYPRSESDENLRKTPLVFPNPDQRCL